MKRSVWAVAILLLVFASVAPAFAGGGKNRGEKGQGDVVQEQIRNSDCGTPAFESKK